MSDASTYVSTRVYDGIRIKSGEEAARYFERIKRWREKRATETTLIDDLAADPSYDWKGEHEIAIVGKLKDAT